MWLKLLWRGMRHCGQNMQEVELKRLAEWIGETARSGGLVSAPFCFGQQDAAARDWQSPAVEKRCVIPSHFAYVSRSTELGRELMMSQYGSTVMYSIKLSGQTRASQFHRHISRCGHHQLYT